MTRIGCLDVTENETHVRLRHHRRLEAGVPELIITTGEFSRLPYDLASSAGLLPRAPDTIPLECALGKRLVLTG